MIQMHPDTLMFETSNGEIIPCSAEQVTIEFIGEVSGDLDPELVRNAARAVLHYFKVELGKSQVSVGEFAQALTGVLRGLGLDVRDNGSNATPAPAPVMESDLRQLASASGKGFELAFFVGLRAELREKLRQAPCILRFKGLRGCVKQLSGARRWNRRCQQLNDQIVDYLRTCLLSEKRPGACSLVVC
jgi:hypothetical protein